MANAQLSSAKDLFEDMGSKVASASQEIGDDETKIVDEIESLCMNCHEDGMTRLLLTKIPFFREIIIMSFDCPHCNFRNSEVQPAGEIQQRGHKYIFKVDSAEDLNRQIVKSDTCVFRVEQLDLEIPPGRGQLTNLEGILGMVASDLGEAQDERKNVAPAMYDRIEEIIAELKAMAAGEKLPLTITIDDPAGNSWIEPSTSDKPGRYVRNDYDRTAAQNEALGLSSGDAQEQEADESVPQRPEYHPEAMYPAMPTDTTQLDQDAADDIVENQVYSFPASCPGCMKSCATNMKMVNIPHFKQVVLMSTVCDHCGYRSNEVKTGGEIPDKGRRLEVQIKTKEDLSRDILKSESCAMSCPELELSVEPGTLGGRFTTIEGLLAQVRDDLKSNIFDADAGGGDSMPSEEKLRWQAFFQKLDAAVGGDLSFTIILQDPLASSYVQSFTAPDPDPQIKVEDYERTEEEEEDLGLRDIQVEGYEEQEEQQQQGEIEAGAEGDELEKAKRFLEKTTGAQLDGENKATSDHTAAPPS